MVNLDGTGHWQIANHVTYESHGKVVAETNAAVDSLFTSFGRYVDPATGNRYHGNRWCSVYYATWLSPDPIGFEDRRISTATAAATR